MDWSKIKTIFIITFFILDIFLGYQFAQKRSSDQIDVGLEMSTEEQLQADGITYVELPKKDVKENYISAKRKKFTVEETKKLENQNITIDSAVLKSTLKKPVQLSGVGSDHKPDQFLKDYVLMSGKYTYWKYNKIENAYYYYQQYNGKTIYNNYSAMLIIHLNKQNQIVSYEQTLLEDIEEYKRKEDIIPAIKALEILYKKDLLKQGSHVSKVELGYYGLFLFNTSKTYVLTPTWRFSVDGEDYYVNALEGQVIDKNQ